MDKIIADLKFYAGTTPETPQTYAIRGPITAEDIRALVNLPFEVSITEQNRRLVLSPGQRSTSHHKADTDTSDRHQFSRLSFHTHRRVPGERLSTPSLSDLYQSLFRAEAGGLANMLADQNGLIMFSFDREQLNNEENRDLLEQLIDAKSDGELTDAELAYHQLLQRKFAERTGAIVMQASWEDHDKIEQIMSQFRTAVE